MSIAGDISGCAVAPSVRSSGGYFDLPTGRKKTKEQIRKERERFGIIPKKVAKVVARVAQRIDDPDNAADALMEALQDEGLKYLERYVEFLKHEMKQRDDEEFAVAFLLM